MTADISLIQTVLVNLIDNACKASEPGGRIEIEGRVVEETSSEKEKPGRTGVSVQCQGLRHRDPAEEISRITQAFYMVDKSRARSKNGAGLGLALCVEILRLHGSVLKIESQAGEGACMSFILPDKEGGK